MQTAQLHTILAQISERIGHEFDPFVFKEGFETQVYEGEKGLFAFIDDLTARAGEIGLGLVASGLPVDELAAFVSLDMSYPVLVFSQQAGQYEPLLIYKEKKQTALLRLTAQGAMPLPFSEEIYKALFVYTQQADSSMNGKVLFLASFTIDNLLDEPGDAHPEAEPPSPWQRFMRLLGNEKQDIVYIYIYAILVSLFGLIVPLGIQRVIGFVSSGQTFSSVYLLITLVVAGTLLSGLLQIVQVSLVETLQQRIFAQAAFEFSYRVPRIRSEALLKHYPPELMNRFFDVITIQKSLPKFLIDTTAAVLQILLGLILLGFYNSSFILFGLFLLGILMLVFYLSTPRGLQTSLNESKYKYKVAHWLEEIARNLSAFKLAGNSNLPMQKMDYFVSNYLHYRQQHFRVLKLLFVNSVLFKVLVTGAMLILGTFLVIDRQISLGQFVASEIVIILIIGSVEKLILSMDVIYDLLTSVEKLGQVTDLPLEAEKSLRQLSGQSDKGLTLSIEGLRYRYPGAAELALRGVDLKVEAGSHICLCGPTDSGKSTLTRLISGLLESYEGIISLNGISLKNFNIHFLRDQIRKVISMDDVFNGTLLENLTMGKGGINFEDLAWAVHNTGLQPMLNALPEGFYTEITAAGHEFSESDLLRINLARSIVTRPKLLIINDLFQSFSTQEKMHLLHFLLEPQHPWSLIIISNDPQVMALCDKVVVMNNGLVAVQGSYSVLTSHPAFKALITETQETLVGDGPLSSPRQVDKRFSGG